MYNLPLLVILPLSAAYVLLPSLPQVPLVPPPMLYLLPRQPFPLQSIDEPIVSTFESDLVFSARPNITGRAGPILCDDRIPATRNIDLCFFLGKDIYTSHIRCNPNWADGTLEGIRRYINEMTCETTKMLGVNNFKLRWTGPFARTENSHKTSEENIFDDVLSMVDGQGRSACDAVVFLLFNHFSEDCKTNTPGHTFGGISQGGMCEVNRGRGYTAVVDQGFLGDAWTGPQILAHHLLLMLTSDLPDRKKTCPRQESLLFSKLLPGKQRVDACVVDKLKRSGVTNRGCMRN